jgi:K+-transporting ATPase ATPase C chain
MMLTAMRCWFEVEIIMNTVLRPMLVLFAALTLVTGVVYPLAVTGIGAWIFPRR